MPSDAAKRIPMTTDGFDRLQKEGKRLKSVERPQIAQAIAEARAHGDLSENAEYHAAKEQQSHNESRISEIENCLRHADVIDVKGLSGKDIKFGATVTLIDIESKGKVIYKIVGEYEADVKEGLLSVTSPLARALIGKQKGDDCSCQTPSGMRDYEILKVAYR